VVENPRFAVRILMIYVIKILSEIYETSGLNGHVAISGCPSISHLFVDTFSEFVVVENFAFTAGSIRILTSEAFGCMSQHERKIPQVAKFQNNSCVFDVMSNNFRCTDRRSDCCILYSYTPFIYGKSLKTAPPNSRYIFTDAET